MRSKKQISMRERSAIASEKRCALVFDVTNKPGLTKNDRRREQVKSAAQKSPKAKMLTLADKTSNLRALAREVSHEEDARDYAQWARRSVRPGPFAIAQMHRSKHRQQRSN